VHISSLGSDSCGGVSSEARKNISVLYILIDVQKPTRFALWAFVLRAETCAKIPVQNFDGLRYYTSGKPCLSSVFSYNSDPKPQQTSPIYMPAQTDAKKPA
jgi:hypothetical protein